MPAPPPPPPRAEIPYWLASHRAALTAALSKRRPLLWRLTRRGAESAELETNGPGELTPAIIAEWVCDYWRRVGGPVRLRVFDAGDGPDAGRELHGIPIVRCPPATDGPGEEGEGGGELDPITALIATEEGQARLRVMGEGALKLWERLQRQAAENTAAAIDKALAARLPQLVDAHMKNNFDFEETGE